MFTKYENGAEVEIEEVYRYESGAEVEAEAVYKYANGAEEEVWSSGSPYTFHQYGQYNCTINGDGSATMGFSWGAQSGDEANLVISGVFEAGKEYTLTFDATINRTESSTTNTDYKASTIKLDGSQSYTIVAGSNTVTITPSNTTEILQIYTSDGGQYYGTLTLNLTDIRINGRLVEE